MSEFFHQYFDFHVMGDHFGEVLEGFLKNLLLFAVVVILALIWGLVLALLRQLPGRKFVPAPLPDDRLHRRPAGDPAPDHHAADLGRPPLPRIHPERDPHPAMVRTARPVLVRRHGA